MAATEAGLRSRDPQAATKRVALIYAMNTPGVPLFDFDADVAAGLFQGLSEQQGQLVITNLSERRPGESYQDFFFRSHIDAAVLRVNDATRHVALEIADEKLPCVVASDRYAESSIGFVGYESRTGLSAAINHLVDLGHRSIGYVQPMPHTNHDFNERLATFQDGIARHGLKPEDTPIINTEISREGGASAIDQLLTRSTPPTAVIFATPHTTIGGTRRALQRGTRIPDDLSVVGFDDGKIRHSVFPAYSAVCQDARQIGYETARIVLDKLRDRKNGRSIEQLVLTSVFEVNETTAPPAVNRS